jgi:hypothetical protein
MKEESPIKTVNPNLAYLNLAKSKNFQYAYTTFTNVVNEFADEVEKAYDHHLTKVASDPIKEEIEFYKTLNTDLDKKDDNGNDIFNADFLSFWIDKYQTAHYRVKREVELELGDDNVFFSDFNESIVSLRHHYFTQDRSTQHIFDTDSVMQDIPNQYNGTLREALDYQTIFTIYELSKLTTAVFRQNLAHLGEPQKMEADGTTAEQVTLGISGASHGISLAADYLHPHRMSEIAAELASILYRDLKGLNRLSYFLEVGTSHQEVRKQSIGTDVEQLLVKVDFLGRKLTNTDYGVYASSTRTNDVLGATGKTTPQYPPQPFDPQL